MKSKTQMEGEYQDAALFVGAASLAAGLISAICRRIDKPAAKQISAWGKDISLGLGVSALGTKVMAGKLAEWEYEAQAETLPALKPPTRA